MTLRTQLILAASLITVATAAFAQDASTATATTTTVAGHPRVNEVNQRLTNQENRTDTGVAGGTINAKQEARDDARTTKVSQELSADEAKHNGHVTKAEQHHMNRQLNRNSHAVARQKAN